MIYYAQIRTEQFRPARELLEAIGKPLMVSANPEAVAAAPPVARGIKALRFDISEADHDLLVRIASRMGLSIACYVRMRLLERLKEDERASGF